MAQVKQCNGCGKTLPITNFSKRTASKDGLQPKCKGCNSKDNLQFRTEKPEHHQIWQKKNPTRLLELVSKYRRGDKPGIIYYIKNPAGQYYIGMSNTYLNVRLIEHKVKWRRWVEGNGKLACPLLFNSISKWGWENHRTGIIIKDENIDRKGLRELEKETIKFFKSKGISLNKQI